ncbi:unnamed protein product [Allacma fusca]|uniref:DUF4604 domain-containing protein n=1 Tax=Allacma fusca TaxID=39272 RepID=A0A8J2KL04_9HEXA|nr:unnamed protein product [Allacma fusca]
MSKKGKKNAVSFAKPPEPAFLRRIKEQIGYKEGPTVDTKRENLPDCDPDDLEDRDDEKPTVVVLKSGDLTQEQAEELGVLEEHSKEPKRIMYKQPTKRPANEADKEKLRKEVTAKKVKNASLLSFDEEEDDDEED